MQWFTRAHTNYWENLVLEVVLVLESYGSLLTRPEGNKRGRNGDLQLRSFSFINQLFKKDLYLCQWHRLGKERPWNELGLTSTASKSAPLSQCLKEQWWISRKAFNWTKSLFWAELQLRFFFRRNLKVPILVNWDEINKFTDPIAPVMRTDKTTPLFEGN